MKLKYIIHTFVGLAFLWMNTSCDSYLDKLPDNRATLPFLFVCWEKPHRII